MVYVLVGAFFAGMAGGILAFLGTRFLVERSGGVAGLAPAGHPAREAYDDAYFGGVEAIKPTGSAIDGEWVDDGERFPNF